MISVIGLGFVGLTTALGLSEKGNKVIGFDIDEEKRNSISKKKIPFHENNLTEVLEKNLGVNFFLGTDLESTIKKSNVIMICVGTPSDEYGNANLDYIKSVIDGILSCSSKEDKKIIVIKSTIPPSTTEKIIVPYIENKGFRTGKDIFVANNPEFLREGRAWEDFINPDRIVIGAEDEYTKEVMKKIYSGFNSKLHFVSLNTGEFIKYLSNTFLATLISYSNEMSVIADFIGGIDIKSAFKIFHEDKRWFGNPANMQSYAYPGCGFGGYCLPKDTSALVKEAEEYGFEPKLLKDVLNINKNIKLHWLGKIKKEVPADMSVSVLGLSFKPNSDDVRQTPASIIIKLLLEAGYKEITAYDPIANDLFDKTYNFPIRYAKTLDLALEASKAVIIATGWQEFVENKDKLKDKKVYDLRYIL